jgi:hypothetical protein
MPFDLRPRFERYRKQPPPGRVRFGGVEWGTVLSALVIATALLVLSTTSVATFRRDIPLAGVTDNIQLETTSARMAEMFLLRSLTRWPIVVPWSTADR